MRLVLLLLFLFMLCVSGANAQILNESKATQTLAASGQIDCSGGRIGGTSLVTTSRS